MKFAIFINALAAGFNIAIYIAISDHPILNGILGIINLTLAITFLFLED